MQQACYSYLLSCGLINVKACMKGEEQKVDMRRL